MSYANAVQPSTIQQWVDEKLDIQKIREKLESLSLDEETIVAHIQEFKKKKYANRQFKGFICLGLGAFLGFISCTLTLTNPIPEMYYWFLYGLTSVALTIIFLGLYYVLE